MDEAQAFIVLIYGNVKLYLNQILILTTSKYQ